MITYTKPKVGDDDLLTTMQACKMLGICRATLYKYERLGYLSSVLNFSGRRVFTGREIKKLYTKTRLY